MQVSEETIVFGGLLLAAAHFQVKRTLLCLSGTIGIKLFQQGEFLNRVLAGGTERPVTRQDKRGRGTVKV